MLNGAFRISVNYLFYKKIYTTFINKKKIIKILGYFFFFYHTIFLKIYHWLSFSPVANINPEKGAVAIQRQQGQPATRELMTKEQKAYCHYSLESAHQKGKKNSIKHLRVYCTLKV